MTGRHALLLLGALFLVSRLLLVLSAADRISEPDSAETKLMVLGDRWISEGAFPPAREVLRLARAGTNAPHGAYLPVSLGYAVLARPFGETGNYLALKLVAIGIGLLAMFVWIALAEELSTGPPGQAGFAMGLLFLFAPGEMLLGGLVPWGSHPEGILFGGQRRPEYCTGVRGLQGRSSRPEDGARDRL